MAPFEGFNTVVAFENIKSRTKEPKKLKGETISNLTVQYDPDVYNKLLKEFDQEQEVSIWEPFFMFSKCRISILVKRFKGRLYLTKFEPVDMIPFDGDEVTCTFTPSEDYNELISKR